MNLKVLAILLIYYGLLSSMFLLGGSTLNDFDSNIEIPNSNLNEDELDTGGVFSGGVSFSKFLFFVGLGVGLPSSTPSWFSGLFILVQSMISLFSIGFIISSIWNG